MAELSVIKVGGNVINDPALFTSFLKDFSSLKGYKILVHGGGKIATEMGNKLGIQSKYVDGRRITDDETIDLVTMVYAGLINKKAVAQLQSFDCNALGITGADANLIPAIKRPVKEIDYGWAGDLNSSKLPLQQWEKIINQGIIPVVAPITHDGKGHLLNTNADTIASTIAIALSSVFETNLILCFEKKGVLENVEDEDSVIRHIDSDRFIRLKSEHKLFAGILPKLQNALDAIDQGVKKVVIGYSGELAALVNGNSGTQIV